MKIEQTFTRKANDPDRFTPFSAWLRELGPPLDSRNISNQNLDYVWHNYRESWIITIEEKRFGAWCNRAQSDTHGIVSQMLSNSSGMQVQTLRGIRPCEYRGHYVIRFSQTTPDDSDTIIINGQPVDKAALMRLLETGKLDD